MRVADPSVLSPAEYQRLVRFRHALRVLERRSDDGARSAGLTPAQHDLLLAVKGHPAATAPSASDMAVALQLRRNSVVELINRAEVSGLICRRPDPADARRHLLVLTPLGENRLAALSGQHRDELERLGWMMRAAGEPR